MGKKTIYFKGLGEKEAKRQSSIFRRKLDRAIAEAKERFAKESEEVTESIPKESEN